MEEIEQKTSQDSEEYYSDDEYSDEDGFFFFNESEGYEDLDYGEFDEDFIGHLFPRADVVRAKIVGEGNYGSVYKVHGATKHDGFDDDSNFYYHCYNIDENLAIKNGAEGEADFFAILKKLDHPNIVKYRDSSAGCGVTAIAMECINSGANLDGYLEAMKCFNPDAFFEDLDCSKILSEKEKEKCINDVLKGLDYLQKNNILHNDIKPANIIFDDKSGEKCFKICDFGTMQNIYDQEGDNYLASDRGTPNYLAPEKLIYMPSVYGPAIGMDEELSARYQNNQIINNASDIWSAGLTFLALLLGSDKITQEIAKSIEKISSGIKGFNGQRAIAKCQNSINSKIDENIGDERYRILLKNMLTINPLERKSAAECLQELEDPKIHEKAQVHSLQ